jgi:hypothetical protein
MRKEFCDRRIIRRKSRFSTTMILIEMMLQIPCLPPKERKCTPITAVVAVIPFKKFVQFYLRRKETYRRYFLCSVPKFYFYFRQLLACKDS